MDTAITNTRGKIAVVGFKGDIIDMDCSIAIIKKYIFASLLNCMNRHTGKNVSAVYFVVRM